MRIGVISDTHGLLRPEALTALAGSNLILHAGDVGSAEVLDALAAIAPVHAVRGNNDRGAWAESLPETREISVDELRLLLIHNLKELADDPARRYRVVISGHSHRPAALERAGILYLNPGSAGPRRFRLPVSIAQLRISRGRVRHEIVTLVP